jgi:hypothetical protein
MASVEHVPSALRCDHGAVTNLGSSPTAIALPTAVLVCPALPCAPLPPCLLSPSWLGSPSGGCPVGLASDLGILGTVSGISGRYFGQHLAVTACCALGAFPLGG